jgi:phospholipid/cholesterol/gamma-HCH transport system substrate-binding protein
MKKQEDLRSSLAELSKTMEQFHSASLTMNSILDENKTDRGAVTNFNKISGNFSKISDSLNKADLGKTVKNLNKTGESGWDNERIGSGQRHNG